MYFKEQIKKILALAFNYNIAIYKCRDLSGRIYNEVLFETVKLTHSIFNSLLKQEKFVGELN